MQRHFIDRCEARAAALYLFLVTVGDAQGLSYYGGATLLQRLHLSAEELGAARQRLIELDLIAYEAPLYQVLSLPGEPSPQTMAPVRDTTGPVRLRQLLQQWERRCD